jgi:hypothetical protein
MKLLKITGLAISSLILLLSSNGCSYVSDTVEGLITDRASFTATAEYSAGTVTIRWDETDDSDEFAGIEIYRTSKPNDEFSSYILVASRHYTPYLNSGDLTSGFTTTCNVDAPAISGVYFYRVGIIHIDTDDDDNPYDASNSLLYDLYTDINAISGYARVVIP